MDGSREKGVRALLRIADAIGSRVDYVQGGGGNISVKFSDHEMMIKASGYRIDQITEENGFVVVNHRRIAEFYEGVDSSMSEIDIEKRGNAAISTNTVATGGQKPARPSVEVGFHSILKKYVIHTHSVYANIIGCAEGSAQDFSKIFGSENFEYATLAYINPGHFLSVRISRLIDEMKKVPKVIFLENHGLIVTSDDLEDCIHHHAYVNQKIMDALAIDAQFPEAKIKVLGDHLFESQSPYLLNYLRHHEITIDLLNKYRLYPDQLVYLNGNITGKQVIAIDNKTKTIRYKTTYDDALNIEQTLVGYLYILQAIEGAGAIKTMNNKGVDFINNWESEAYRKNLNR